MKKALVKGGRSHGIEEIRYDCYSSEFLKKLLIHLSVIYPFYIIVCCRCWWAMLVIWLGAYARDRKACIHTGDNCSLPEIIYLHYLFSSELLLSYFKFKLMTINTSSYTYCNFSRVQKDRRWCRNKRRKGRVENTCWKKLVIHIRNLYTN